MARALIRHAEAHRDALRGMRPRGDVSSEPNGPFGGRLVVTFHPPTSVKPGESLDFNLEIRHLLDDLRSALEFCAFDAFERSVPRPYAAGLDRKVSFPVVPPPESTSSFKKQVAKAFPGLQSVYPRAIAAMESAQHYSQSGHPWLYELHVLWNEGKHRNLVYHSAGPPFIEVGPVDPSKSPTLRFVDGLTFAKTGKNVEKFVEAATNGATATVDLMARALYP